MCHNRKDGEDVTDALASVGPYTPAVNTLDDF